MIDPTRVSIENQGPGNIKVKGITYGPLGGCSIEIPAGDALSLEVVEVVDEELYISEPKVRFKRIANLISMANCQHVTDQYQNITGIIIPFEIWVAVMEAVSVDDE